MDVEETKRLILRRLKELREAEEQSSASRRDRPLTPPPPRRRRRPRGGGWFGSRRKNGLEGRLEELTDRLATIERHVIGAPDQQGQQRARQTLDQVRQSLRLASTGPGAGVGGGLPSHGPPAVDGRDFGGRPYQLTGGVEDGLMTDVLQLVAANQKTGCFSLFVDATADEPARRFDLFFREGDICHAECGELEGENAFFALMSVGHKHGYYGFLDGEEVEGKQTIEGKTQFLILEALRRIDEEQGKRDAADSDAGGGDETSTDEEAF